MCITVLNIYIGQLVIAGCCYFVVFTLGNNALGQCGRAILQGETYSGSRTIHTIDREDIVKVVCGHDHTLMLTNDGKVFSCGLGTDGQTGRNIFTD